MDVFWHVNESKKIKGMSGTGGFDASREKDSPSVGHEEWQAVITGKGEFMGMAGFIEMVDLLTVRWEISHDRLYQENLSKGKRRNSDGEIGNGSYVDTLADKPPVAPASGTRHPAPGTWPGKRNRPLSLNENGLDSPTVYLIDSLL